MKKNKVFSIEGLGASGKSTLLQYLRDKGMGVIPEICDEYPETKNIQAFSLNPEKIDEVNKWFLEKEISRMKKARDTYGATVMDRSVYSQLVYNYARDKLYHTNGLKKFFTYLKKNNLGDDILPGIIFISIDPKTSINRMMARDKNSEKENIKNNTPSYTEEYMHMLIEAYTRIIPAISPFAYIASTTTIEKEKEKLYNWMTLYNDKSKVSILELERRLL